MHECEHLDGILFTDRADHIMTQEELDALDEAAMEEMEAEGEQA